VRLFTPLDEDGCSRTIDIEKYDHSRPEHKDAMGWQGVLSREPLSAFHMDSDGRVRWGFLLQPKTEKATSAVFGVAHAGASLQPETWGTDDHSWGVCVFAHHGPAPVHGGQERYTARQPNDGKLRDYPRVVWCIADLRTNTLSFVFELLNGQREAAPVRSVGVRLLGECFAYMAKDREGAVTLVLPGEPL
jgi:hypothetical protein